MMTAVENGRRHSSHPQYGETVNGYPSPGNNAVSRGCEVTDAGLVHLKGLTSLQHLSLSNKVTDAGLAHLKDLTSLQMLNPSGSQVTDAGLEHIKRLTSLKTLYLTGTQVTTAGVEDLQSALPKCKIIK
jgi:hypothetical protein